MTNKVCAVARLPLFCQFVAYFDLDSARMRQHFHRLQASVRGARQDPFQPIVVEKLRERRRLCAPAPVEGSPSIVACPVAAVARPRMSDQQHAPVSTTPCDLGAPVDARPSAPPPWPSRGG